MAGPCVVYRIVPPARVGVPLWSTNGAYAVTWDPAPGAASYAVEEDTDPAFPAPTRIPAPASASYLLLNGRTNGAYYYRVATVANGLQSDWTEAGHPCKVELRGTLTISQTSRVWPTVERPGSTGIPAMELRMEADRVEDVAIEELRFHAQGTLDDRAWIGALRLFLDADGDGQVDPDADLPLGLEASFDADDGSALVRGISRTIPAGGSETWLVAVDLADSAPLACTFRIGLLTRGDFTASGPVSGCPAVRGFPLWGPGKSVGVGGSLHVFPWPGASARASLDCGSGDAVLLDLALATGPAEAVRVSTLVVNATGTLAEPSGAVSVSLWEDRNENGVPDEGDRRIRGPVPFLPADRRVAFPGMAETLSAASCARWLLTVDVAPSAPAGGTLGLSVESCEDVAATGEWTLEAIRAGGLPVRGEPALLCAAGAEPANSGGCCAAPGVPASAGGLLGQALLLLAPALAAAMRRRTRRKTGSA
jgi:hypothetical protein